MQEQVEWWLDLITELKRQVVKFRDLRKLLVDEELKKNYFEEISKIEALMKR